jgi:hypothetical protein
MSGAKSDKKRETSGATAESQWEVMYNQVFNFVQTNKHARIPVKLPHLKKMNEWWHGQLRRKSHPEEERAKILAIKEMILPDERDKKKQNNKSWERLFTKLQGLKNETGFLLAKDMVNKELLRWVNEQRRLAAANQLTSERRSKLQDLGFSFALYNNKLKFDEETRWINTGQGGLHMAHVGLTPSRKVVKKEISVSTGEKVVCQVLIQWSSNMNTEWVSPRQVGDLVTNCYGRGKKRKVSSPLAAEEKRKQVLRSETTVYISKMKYRALAKANPILAAERYISQLQLMEIKDIPLKKLFIFLEYVANLDVKAPSGFFCVLKTFYPLDNINP